MPSVRSASPSIRSKDSKASTTKPRAVSPSNSRPVRKPTWDSYLKDTTDYAISKDELLRRKQERISKYNAFANPSAPQLTTMKVFNLVDMKKNKVEQILNKNQVKAGSYRGRENVTRTVNTPSTAATTPETPSNEMSSLDLVDDYYHSTSYFNEISMKDMKDVSKQLVYDGPNVSITSKTKSNNDFVGDKDKSGNNVSTSDVTSNKKHQNTKKERTENISMSKKDEPDSELSEMMEEIKLLHQELRYYEQLSGKRSILDADELESVFANNDKINLRSTMKYLIRLVCQSMSYLLKSELELQNQQKKYDALKEKIGDELNEPIQDSSSKFVVGVSSKTNELQNVSEISPVRINKDENNYFHTPNNSKPNIVQMNDDEMNFPFTPNEDNKGNITSLSQYSEMNGSSPTDWLFNHQLTSLEKQKDSSGASLRLFPDTTGKYNKILLKAPVKNNYDNESTPLTIEDLQDIKINLDLKFDSLNFSPQISPLHNTSVLSNHSDDYIDSYKHAYDCLRAIPPSIHSIDGDYESNSFVETIHMSVAPQQKPVHPFEGSKKK